VISLLANEEAAGDFCETPAAALLEFGRSGEPPQFPRLAAGTRFGAYEVVSFLAAGGMGEVYRARHTLLDRAAAIKIVRVAGGSANRRLIAEARHASILDHPNICTVYEAGEQDKVPFIAMELIDGIQLRELLRRRLPGRDEALEIGIHIADALSHAHEKGILHRDLKSANVMVDNAGRPVVLDFGLARRFERGRTDRAEETSGTGAPPAGTLSHMPPEVLRGERGDVRSDIWSLGILLYELVTGRLPFEGETTYETARRILDDAPAPMGRTTPLALRLVVDKCLAKQPEKRYETAAQVRDALSAIRAHATWRISSRLLLPGSVRKISYAAAMAAVTLVSIIGMRAAFDGRRDSAPLRGVSTLAVIPFTDGSAASGDRFYAEGFTDALVEQIGRTMKVRVVSLSGSSVVPARGMRAAGDAVLQGRVTRKGERVAVDVRLIDPHNGKILWSDSFDRRSGQVLALQADVIRALASEISLRVRDTNTAAEATPRAVNPEAYEEYLKGRYEWNKRNPDALRLAIAHFQRAIDLDPSYAPPHAAIADCYNQFATVMVGMGSPLEYRPRAIAEAIAALQINPWSAEAHATLGYAYHYDWRWDDADRELRRAMELNPSYALAHVWYANLLMSRNQMADAMTHLRVALALDPYSLIVNTNLGWLLSAAGKNEEAIAQLKSTLALDSIYSQAQWRLVMALMAVGRKEEAEREARRLVRMTSSSPPSLALLASAQYAVGKRAEARRILETLLDRSRREYVVPGSIAGLFGMFGDRENQLRWLRLAFRERSNGLAYHTFDGGPWKSDPRFAALVRESGALKGRFPPAAKGTSPAGTAGARTK
jgi:serine/threonine-protein kinase